MDVSELAGVGRKYVDGEEYSGTETVALRVSRGSLGFQIFRTLTFSYPGVSCRRRL